MNSSKDLSIIIPCYNASRTIKYCMESILNNLKTLDLDYEIIVVDDCSSDNTVELVKSLFHDVKIIRNKKNMGAAYTRNKGIFHAKGKILMFIDHDVYLKDDCIRKLIAPLLQDYGLDITYPTVLCHNGEKLSPSTEFEKYFVRKSTIFAIRFKSLNRLDEFFDENYFVYYEDIDFFFRCFLRGLKAKYIPDAIAFHPVISESRILFRLYMELKNILYCIIKFRRIKRLYKKIFKIPNLISFLRQLVYVGIFGVNTFAGCYHKKKVIVPWWKTISILVNVFTWILINRQKILYKAKHIARHYVHSCTS